MDDNEAAEVDEYNEKKDELQKICIPIMSKIYQNEPGGMPGGMPKYQSAEEMNEFDACTTVEEVD